ncbi:hypothetical protein [Spiroplasma endosymbiont of Zeiraphera isertana]|uniref:hypothetical protein n=1 Tax=Spiroplasma endosymbiont of Zeiraphera isertana TaxID=3066313 RepID=UPI00313CD352
MTSWFYLIFRWINTKHGIPATDVARELGVTYKTVEWQHFLGLFFGRHLFLIINWS